MRGWIALALIIGAVLTVGIWLWWPPGHEPNRYSDLGVTLIGGAVVAVALFYLEQQFSRGAERRDLRLQLALQKDLSDADLRDRDMSGFSLVGKNFKGADIRGADLRGADLSGANLHGAKLNGADLRGAKMDKTPLYPSETLYPPIPLGPIYPDATISRTGFSEAKYDSETKWPRNIDPETLSAVKVEKRWRIFGR
jgi:hypothetical protein